MLIILRLCYRGVISQSSDECNGAKKCGECIENANCFWCSESDVKDIGARCFSKATNNDIVLNIDYDIEYDIEHNMCSKKEDPKNDLVTIQDDDINLG